MKNAAMIAGLLLVAGAASAHAERLPLSHGTWAYPAAACSMVDRHFDAALKYSEDVFVEIRSGRVLFYEADCRIRSARGEGGGRWTARLSCTGEGENYNHDWKIVRHDARSFTVAGTSARYTLCGR